MNVIDTPFVAGRRCRRRSEINPTVRAACHTAHARRLALLLGPFAVYFGVSLFHFQALRLLPRVFCGERSGFLALTGRGIGTGLTVQAGVMHSDYGIANVKRASQCHQSGCKREQIESEIGASRR
jgi:hypothetical protein